MFSFQCNQVTLTKGDILFISGKNGAVLFLLPLADFVTLSNVNVGKSFEFQSQSEMLKLFSLRGHEGHDGMKRLKPAAFLNVLSAFIQLVEPIANSLLRQNSGSP